MILQYEGNIGSGKTTHASRLVEALRAEGLSVVHLVEPVLVWTNYCNTNLLELYYNDRQRYGFLFQSVALTTMVNNEITATSISDNNSIVIIERSCASVRLIFNRLLKETDMLLAAESFALDAICDITPRPIYNRKDHITLYVKTPPTVCHERMKHRNRNEETDTISSDYLGHLHDIHEKTVLSGEVFGKVVPIDGEHYTLDDVRVMASVIKKHFLNRKCRSYVDNIVDTLC